MQLHENFFRVSKTQMQVGNTVYDNVTPVLNLLAHCPIYKASPLIILDSVSKYLGISRIYAKDERRRMGLGSFKALGAAYVIAKQAGIALAGDFSDSRRVKHALNGHCFIAASAGNHGISLAAAANVFGAQAVIYLPQTVPAFFAQKLRNFGAKVIIKGTNYESSMAHAMKASRVNNWNLLSDSTWQDYNVGVDVMQGYLVLCYEMVMQLQVSPTHIFVQAGVGGLAAAVAVYARKNWGDAPLICVVEPDNAPALFESIKAGKAVYSDGAYSNMGRLDCKQPSVVALRSLARDADFFMTLSDEECTYLIRILSNYGIETTPSGGAGFAGLAAALANGKLGIDAYSRVLVIISEGCEDG